MAQGFITLEDGSCYITSWRTYDEIIRIVSNQLSDSNSENRYKFSKWLSNKVPKKYIHNDENQWGTGFIDENGKMIIGKSLDLRSLNQQNQRLFWNGLQSGLKKIVKNELETEFNNDAFKATITRLLKMHKLSLVNKNPLEHSDLKIIPEFEGKIDFNK